MDFVFVWFCSAQIMEFELSRRKKDIFAEYTVEAVEAQIKLVSLARDLHGPERAQKLWEGIGLPDFQDSDVCGEAQPFVEHCLIVTGNNSDSIDLSEAFLIYDLWCADQELQPAMSEEFLKMLMAESGRVHAGEGNQGVYFSISAGGKGAIVGARVHPDWDERITTTFFAK